MVLRGEVICGESDPLAFSLFEVCFGQVQEEDICTTDADGSWDEKIKNIVLLLHGGS